MNLRTEISGTEVMFDASVKRESLVFALTAQIELGITSES